MKDTMGTDITTEFNVNMICSNLETWKLISLSQRLLSVQEQEGCSPEQCDEQHPCNPHW